MRSETEEMLWIAAQEDHLVPIQIINYAQENGISMTQILDLSNEELSGIDSSSVKRFFEKTEKIDEKKYRNIWDNVYRHKINMIFYDDYKFPQQLKSAKGNTTVLLYHDGEELPFENCVAVVGTRNCSTHAAEFTRELSRTLVQEGYVVVAGLALGIDMIAHRGALSAGGKTIAVLPWMYSPTPKSNYRLLEEIKENGFAISDTFFNTEGMMAKARFVHRNEIISGISDFLIAVESGITGGTRHQVEIALRQKKTVIVPEPLKENKTAYEGFEKFVELGAIPVTSIEEILSIIKNTKQYKDTTLLEFPK
jgi:DNA protecting protein DprA